MHQKKLYLLTISFNAEKNVLSFGDELHALQKSNKNYYKKFTDAVFNSIKYVLILENVTKNYLLKVMEEFSKQNKITVKYLTLNQLNRQFLSKNCKKGGGYTNRIKVTPPNFKL